jgi:MacB-like periplasmic core domain
MRWWQIRKRNLDLERELQSDLELEEQAQRENGVPPEEARYAALRAFGNPTLIREQIHEAWGWTLFEHVWQDIRYALRQMRKSPGFTTVVGLTLALGIGANASVFSVLNAVVLRPLQFPNANRLVEVTSLKEGKPVGPSPPDVKDFIAQSRTFEKMAVYDEWRKNVSVSAGGEGAQELLVGLAPRELFEALGVRPLLGRLFTAEEGLPGRNHVALITETFWRTRFQHDPKILERTLTINDHRGSPRCNSGMDKRKLQPAARAVRVGAISAVSRRVERAVAKRAGLRDNWAAQARRDDFRGSG